MAGKIGILIRIKAGLLSWLESGKDPQHLPREWEYLAQSCWIHDYGEKAGLPPEAKEYATAAAYAWEDAEYNHFLNQRTSCARCGESYKLENIAVCADCYSTVCHRCVSGGKPWHEGKTNCGCGGDFVG